MQYVVYILGFPQSSHQIARSYDSSPRRKSSPPTLNGVKSAWNRPPTHHVRGDRGADGLVQSRLLSRRYSHVSRNSRRRLVVDPPFVSEPFCRMLLNDFAAAGQTRTVTHTSVGPTDTPASRDINSLACPTLPEQQLALSGLLSLSPSPNSNGKSARHRQLAVAAGVERGQGSSALAERERFEQPAAPGPACVLCCIRPVDTHLKRPLFSLHFKQIMECKYKYCSWTCGPKKRVTSRYRLVTFLWHSYDISTLTLMWQNQDIVGVINQ